MPDHGTILTVPLHDLAPSPRNVRKTGGMSIEELAASIRAHGLLQNLNVTESGRGKYGVVAGARRLRALQQLATAGDIPADYPVPCKLQAAERAHDTSLAENTVREPMHPADQFEAFQALADDGRSVFDIATSFGVSELVVRQRLKLAKVAPGLLDAYRAGEMDLEALEAFTLTNDHGTQLRVWADAVLYPWQRKAIEIRGKLTGKEVNASTDRRARLVGIGAYENAGGKTRTDLFGGDVYMDNPTLLHELADSILQDAAKRLRNEGWKWVEVATEGAETWRYERKHGKRQPLTAEEERELAAVRAQIAEGERMLEQLDDAAPVDEAIQREADALHEQLESLDEQAQKLNQGTETWSAKAMANAGAIVELSRSGNLVIHRGLVKPADAKRAEREAASKTQGDAKPNGADMELSEALLRNLTAHRTAVLKYQLTHQPRVALAVLAYHLLQSAFGVHWYTHLGTMSAPDGDRLLDRDGVAADYPPRVRLLQITEAWRGEIPDDPAAALDYLLGLSAGELDGLLAVCTALAFDATTGRVSDQNQRPVLIDRLCEAMDVDMTDHWKPTAANYLGRVPTTLIRSAVLDAGFAKHVGDQLMDMKRAAAAKEAEDILIPARWLPEPLRRLAPIPAPSDGKRRAKAKKA